MTTGRSPDPPVEPGPVLSNETDLADLLKALLGADADPTFEPRGAPAAMGGGPSTEAVRPHEGGAPAAPAAASQAGETPAGAVERSNGLRRWARWLTGARFQD